MIVQDHALVFDPAMRAEGEGPDAEFPVSGNAHEGQEFQQDEAAEKAGLMTCEDIGREPVKAPRQVPDRFCRAILCGVRLPPGCAGEGPVETGRAPEPGRAGQGLQEGECGTPCKLRFGTWAWHVVQRSAGGRPDLRERVMPVLRMPCDQVHLAQAPRKSVGGVGQAGTIASLPDFGEPGRLRTGEKVIAIRIAVEQDVRRAAVADVYTGADVKGPFRHGTILAGCKAHRLHPPPGSGGAMPRPRPGLPGLFAAVDAALVEFVPEGADAACFCGDGPELDRLEFILLAAVVCLGVHDCYSFRFQGCRWPGDRWKMLPIKGRVNDENIKKYI